jgi:hypothetical protein
MKPSSTGSSSSLKSKEESSGFGGKKRLHPQPPNESSSSTPSSTLLKGPPALKGWNDFLSPHPSYKPRMPLPICPVEPYFFVEPVDFSPFVDYEPTEMEVQPCILPQPTLDRIWTLDPQVADEALAQNAGADFDPLPDYVQMLLDLEDDNVNRKLMSNPVRNMAAFVKTHQLSKWEEMALQDLETAEHALKRYGHPDFLDDPNYPRLAGYFPEALGEDQSATPLSRSASSSSLEDTGVQEQATEGGQEWKGDKKEPKETHPDHHEWTCVRKRPVRINAAVSSAFGSVLFEDEQPPEMLRLRNGLLKVVGDASLSTGTAGWLYLPVPKHVGESRLKLHRDLELDLAASERDYDLIALALPHHVHDSKEADDDEHTIDEDDCYIAVQIREAYRVHRRPRKELELLDHNKRVANPDEQEADEELLEELRVKPDMEIDRPTMHPISLSTPKK